MTTLAHLWEIMGRPEAWVVGGWVRDRVMGRPSGDIDIVVAGPADVVAEAARRIGREIGGRAHLLGREPRSVWRVEGGDLEVEIWALGQLSLEQDIRRRDFTCNALMWPLPDGPVFDVVGGLDDIRAGRLRAMCSTNLEKDPVRLLRCCRFLAEFPGFRLEEQTGSWLAELAPALAAAPRERVGKELVRLLAGESPSRGLAVMAEYGLMAPAAPGAVIDESWLGQHMHAADLLSRSGRHPMPSALDEAPAAARLAFLVRAWGCPGRRKLNAYAWQRSTLDLAERAAGMIDVTTEDLDSLPAERRQLLHRAGSAAPVLLALGSAIDRVRDRSIEPWRRLWRLWRRQRSILLGQAPLLSAEEVAAHVGLPPGPALGETLRALTLARVRGDIRSATGARRFLDNLGRDL